MCSQQNICLKEVIAAETDVNIVLIIMKLCLNQNVRIFYQRKKIKNHNNNMAGKKNLSQETLKKLKPSGKKDESFFEQVFDVARMIPKEE